MSGDAMKLFAPVSENKRAFQFGWYGDNGMGEFLLRAILAGKKTASACPVYDPQEAEVGEILSLVDKDGKARGKVRITRIEFRKYSEIDETLAARLGQTLEDMRKMAKFANSRPIGEDEQVRITHFELVPE